MQNGTILVVEDSAQDLELLMHVLDNHGLDVDVCTHGLEAQARLLNTRYSAVLLNLKLPDMDGITLLHWVRARWPDTLICVVTGHEDPVVRQSVAHAGAVFFFAKPYTERDNVILLNMLRVRAEAFRKGRRLAAYFKNPLAWAYGLVAAVIGGGATAATTGGGLAIGHAIWPSVQVMTIEQMCAVFMTSAVFNGFLYLKQSPLPKMVDEETQTISIHKKGKPKK